MNIIVLNGSPKGETSVTMQYVHLLEKRFPEHSFEIVHIAQQIKRIEREEERFAEIVAQVQAADGVLWAFPLYVLLVHGGYKRFIELIWERNVEEAFAGKYTASLSTSIHFYDHTAHNYIHSICDDLGMRYVGAFSAEMQDLLGQEGQDLLIAFGRRFFSAIERQAPTQLRYAPVVHQEWDYVAGEGAHAVDVQGKKVVVLADLEPGQKNLQRMVDRFCASFAQEVEVINLREVDIKGGCLGCLQCGYDNQCTYAGKDEYIEMHSDRLMPADVIVFAGAIHDRYLSALWKTFFDRSFYRGHAPSLIGKQVGFIVSGPLSQLANLRQILTAWIELQQSNLAGFVSDEGGDAAAVDALLAALAENLILCAVEGYISPTSFLGVGGKKLFRDEIWGQLRAVFQADHRAYKRLGIYDFPQRDWKVRILNVVATVLFKVPKVREMVYGQMKEQMVAPYRKVVEEK